MLDTKLHWTVVYVIVYHDQCACVII